MGGGPMGPMGGGPMGGPMPMQMGMPMGMPPQMMMQHMGMPPPNQPPMDYMGYQGYPPPGRKPCFAFQRGSCTRGESCRYPHIPAHTNPPMSVCAPIPSTAQVQANMAANGYDPNNGGYNY